MVQIRQPFLFPFYVAAIVPLVFATPVAPAPSPRSFLKKVDNSTWIIGNELWNVTQNRQYATKLYYKEKDRVSNAVGHYVSYSTWAM